MKHPRLASLVFWATFCLVLGLSSPLKAYWPSDMRGLHAVFIIQGGSGIFAPAGSLRLSTTIFSNQYNLAPITADMKSFNGSYEGKGIGGSVNNVTFNYMNLVTTATERFKARIEFENKQVLEIECSA